MRLSPKKELQVLLAIEDLGEASSKEIAEHLKIQDKLSVEEKELLRYLRRLKAKKVLAANVVNGLIVWKVSDIPWMPKSDMARVKTKLTTMSPEEANQVLEKWLDSASKTPNLPIINKYRNFHRIEMTFETMDPILGDRIADGKETGQFPTSYSGKAFVPPSWWKAWFRSNLYLINIPETIAKFRLGYVSKSIETNGNLISIQAIGDKGPKTYEALPLGTKISMVVKYPMVGTPIKSSEQFKQFIEEVSEEPQRGFGANPFYYGGRLKLVEFIDRGLVASKVIN